MGNKQCVELLNLGNNNTQSQQEIDQINTMGDADSIKVQMPQTLKMDDEVEISGTIAEDASVFSIAIVANSNNDGTPANVPYHFKVFFDERRAITNVKYEGRWLRETEVEYPPLEKGGPFLIRIYISQEGYTTRINDEYWRNDPHVSGHQGNALEIWEGFGKLKSYAAQFSD